MANKKDVFFRLQLAQAYQNLTTKIIDINPRSNEAMATVFDEVQKFVETRLEVLMGLKTDTDSVGLSLEEVVVLKALVKRVTEGDVETEEDESEESAEEEDVESEPRHLETIHPGISHTAVPKVVVNKSGKKTKVKEKAKKLGKAAKEYTPDGKEIFTNPNSGRKFVQLIDPRNGMPQFKKDDKGKEVLDEDGKKVPLMTDITPVAKPSNYKPPPQSEQALANVLNSQAYNQAAKLESGGGMIGELASYFVNK